MGQEIVPFDPATVSAVSHVHKSIAYGPKEGVSVSPNEKRLSSKKKLSSGNTVPVPCGGSRLNGIQDWVAAGPEELRPPDAGRLRGGKSDSGKDVLFAVLEVSSTEVVRVLNALGLCGVSGFCGYSHSRSTLVQFLQRGRVSSHLTLRLRQTKLWTVQHTLKYGHVLDAWMISSIQRLQRSDLRVGHTSRSKFATHVIWKAS